MNELIEQLKEYLGTRVEDVRRKDTAELEIVIGEMEDVEALAADIKQHILEIVDENTLGKINFVTPDGEEVYSFSLTQ